ncbi:MAG: WG repeat-containing protein [Nostoc sp.]|uniref:WG repeat-containing protein n=1 Tax=Nostoc sp. TaxID=1180 RepID=UPI002FF30350
MGDKCFSDYILFLISISFLFKYVFYKSFIDKDGKFVVSPQYKNAFHFSEGLAAIKVGGKWGYIDKEGKIVINPQFDDASRKFSEGLIAVELEKKWGYIDKAGKIVINPQFDYANSEFIDKTDFILEDV